jgi:hypothetical protein
VPIGQNYWEKPLKDLLLQELERSGYSEISLFLFGSRAEGTAAAAVSDIDIGLKGKEPLSFILLSHLHEKIDALNLPFKVDLVDFQKVSAEFAEHAMKGAVVWKN